MDKPKDLVTPKTHFKSVSVRAVREAWLNPSLSLKDTAAALGMSGRSLYVRAKGLGLPPRKAGRAAMPWPKDFNDMWKAGVYVRDMGIACNRCMSAVVIEAKARGLRMRGRGAQVGTPTMAQYREVALRLRMEAQAARERRIWLQAQRYERIPA